MCGSWGSHGFLKKKLAEHGKHTVRIKPLVIGYGLGLCVKGGLFFEQFPVILAKNDRKIDLFDSF
jgi:hypothetical protein